MNMNGRNEMIDGRQTEAYHILYDLFGAKNNTFILNIVQCIFGMPEQFKQY